jgi:hypothetical protein
MAVTGEWDRHKSELDSTGGTPDLGARPDSAALDQARPPRQRGWIHKARHNAGASA